MKFNSQQIFPLLQRTGISKTQIWINFAVSIWCLILSDYAFLAYIYLVTWYLIFSFTQIALSLSLSLSPSTDGLFIPLSLRQRLTTDMMWTATCWSGSTTESRHRSSAREWIMWRRSWRSSRPWWGRNRYVFICYTLSARIVYSKLQFGCSATN